MTPDDRDKSPEERAAEYVNELKDRASTTEQSRRENAGFTRRPDDNRASENPDESSPEVGVWDTPNAVPKSQRESRDRLYDPSFRGTPDHKIQGEEVETTGDHRERRSDETHL